MPTRGLIALIDFEDAVTASNLTAGVTHGVFYVDGKYANGTAVKARLPGAKLLGITVLGTTGKDVQICDCETGDLSAASAENWVAKQLNLGVYRPCVYADLVTWNAGLKANLAGHWLNDPSGGWRRGITIRLFRPGMTRSSTSTMCMVSI